MLFDLDGVLVDSTAAVGAAWRRWAALRGFDADHVLGLIHGRRTEEVMRALVPHLDPEEERKAVEPDVLSDHDELRLVPGARELFLGLGDDCRAIVTSGRRATALSRLRFAAIEEPAVLVTAEDVQRGKPDPACYQLAAVRLGRLPGECVVIEDAPAGVRAARAAGMAVVGVTTTHPAEALHEADLVLPDLRGVAERLRDPRGPFGT